MLNCQLVFIFMRIMCRNYENCFQLIHGYNNSNDQVAPLTNKLVI